MRVEGFGYTNVGDCGGGATWGHCAGGAWTPKKGLIQHSGTLPGPISARFSLPEPSEGGFVIGAQWPITGSEYPLARGSYRPRAADDS